MGMLVNAKIKTVRIHWKSPWHCFKTVKQTSSEILVPLHNQESSYLPHMQTANGGDQFHW